MKKMLIPLFCIASFAAFAQINPEPAPPEIQQKVQADQVSAVVFQLTHEFVVQSLERIVDRHEQSEQSQSVDLAYRFKVDDPQPKILDLVWRGTRKDQEDIARRNNSPGTPNILRGNRPNIVNCASMPDDPFPRNYLN